MRLAGPVLGPAFALEGYAFFIEAIFIGLYLYGWNRLTPRAALLGGRPRGGERNPVGDPRGGGERVDAVPAPPTARSWSPGRS
jgi:hypothetical protein